MSGMWFSALEDLLYVSTVSHEQIISNPSVYFILGEFYCLAGWVAGLLCRAGQIPVRGFFSRSEADWCLVSGHCTHCTARQDTTHLQTLAAGVPTLTLVNVKEFYCRTNSDFLRKIWKYLLGRYLLVLECVNDVSRYLQRTDKTQCR